MTNEEAEAAGRQAKPPRGAGPGLASLMAGGIAFMWAEVVVRYMVTGGFEPWNLILPEKVGDVVVIWLAGLAVGLVVFAAVYLVFRDRKRVGSLRAWMAALLVSAFLQYL